ncbi:Dimethyl sulfoxide/trimethylamine N-oxide reductase [Thiomonas sp. X19]|uniref:molybdopterin-dependent oxidoreductase n=1 Tax=Thiomonas sp. X19 TaxID=1050370 RepID=UPI000B663961|nr:molybdopterin-dependent oxidoreductase [Thiomonas sp. X19]SCC91724.1 Dimethyl sulfoxide/trimethylamine N-oxide reductase [Thiomonas sp. X19]
MPSQCLANHRERSISAPLSKKTRRTDQSDSLGFKSDSLLERGFRAGGAGRGREEFVRVSWDDAVSLVATELTRARNSYGAASIFPGTADWQSVGLLHNASGLVRRFLGLQGGYTDCTGDPSVAAAMVILPYVVGSSEVYDEQTAWPVIEANTTLLVLLGADLLKNNQIGTHPADHYAYGALSKFKNKVQSGHAKAVSIDPRTTDTATFLGARSIHPRPNTDTALMLGLAYVLYHEGLYDSQFVARYTVGFDKFLPYLNGVTDGTPKTPSWAASITGVDMKAIIELAHDMAKHRTMIISGYAIQRADHGEQAYWMLITLSAMLGQIGTPGGGYGLSYHYDNGGDLVAHAPTLSGIPGIENPVKTALPFERFTDMLLNPGTHVPYNGKTLVYPDIRLIYYAGGNPLTHLWQTNKVLEAWRRPETIIVQDPFWTATAKYADIVLPVTTTFERNDIDFCGAYSSQYFVAMKKVIDPLFEARSDFEILSAVAGRLGLSRQFTDGKDETAWLRSFYDGARQQGSSQGIKMPTFDEFWNVGFCEFQIPTASRSFVKHKAFRDNPALHPLGTPSGKIEIYSAAIASYNYADCPPHPTWLEPVEWLGDKKAQRFPFHLLSPHPRYRLHSQLDNTWIRAWYEVNEREPAWINPADAQARGIANGDIIRIFNERGEILAGAMVTDRIMQGVLALHEGAWYDPANPAKDNTMCKHGLANVLTMDKGASKLSQGNIANTTLVDVEKFAGNPPPITAFTNPRVLRRSLKQ